MSEENYTPVRELMSHEPLLIDGLATVRQAVDLMSEKRVNSLIVDRRGPGDEFGLLTVRDIAEHIISNQRAPERVSVYEVMAKPVLSVAADMNIKYVVRLLVQLRGDRALIVDNGQLVGIVTLRDLVFRSLVPG